MLRAHRAVGVGAQLKARAAKAAAIVVGAVAQVAQIQLSGVLRGGDLHRKLLVGVVEQQLVEPRAAPFLAAHAQEGCDVVVVLPGSAVPHGAIAVTDAVALPGDAGVGGLVERQGGGRRTAAVFMG